MDFGSLVRTLGERRRTFLGVFGGVLVTAVVGSLLTTPKYEAVAVIQLLPRAGQEMAVAEVVTTEAGYFEARDRARTQMQIIPSRAVREEVVRRYNALGGEQLDTTPDGLDALRDSLTVSPREDTQLVEIGVLDSDPERAARIANLVADVYLETNLEARTDAAREARRWLEGRGERALAAVREASAKSLAFEVANGKVDLDPEPDDIAARRVALQEALAQTTTQRVLLGRRLEEHRRILARGEAALLVSVFEDPGLDALAREQATALTEAAAALARYGAQHPERQRAMAQRDAMESLVQFAVKRNVDAEQAELAGLAEQEGELRDELKRTKRERLEKQRLAAKYAELELEKERARRMYGAIADRVAEVELQAESRLNDVRVVDRALAPTRPVSPDLPLNLAVGIAVGLVAGLGAALLRARLADAHRVDRAPASAGSPLSVLR